MAAWIEQHFSDNVRAQKTIAMIAGGIGAVGFVMFAVAAILLLTR